MKLKEDFVNLRKQYIKKTFSRLNDKQCEGVLTVNGPVLILAGAGSGKTTVLVDRVYNLVKFGNAYNSDEVYGQVNQEDINDIEKALKSGEDSNCISSKLSVSAVKPYYILAITFTNKAAKELKERIAKRLNNEDEKVNAFTFHSLCMRVLRADGNHLGYTNSFTIYDTDDQKRLLKDIYKTMGIDDKTFPYKEVINTISRLKDQMITCEDYIKENNLDYRKKIIAEIYKSYQHILKNSNAMDFDDLIINTVNLFLQQPDILLKYQNRYKYIMVDEYQDTNHIQYKLVSILASQHKNICVVGDDDQSIYKFRGATIENILNFEEHFESTNVIKLEENYRSTGNILSSANGVISNNKKRKGKELWTSKDNGEKITLYRCNNEREEVEFVNQNIQEHVKNGGKLNDIAILYRMNAQSSAIEQFFAKSGITYKIFGGLRFFDRKEIKDVLAYLCVINNQDDNLRLKRIINEPKRGIGDSTIAKAEKIAQNLNTSLFEVLKNAEKYEDLARKSKSLKDFAEIIVKYRNAMEKQSSIHDLTFEMLNEIGYITCLESMGYEGETRLGNIKEFLSNIASFEKENSEGKLSDFLEEIALVTTLDNYNETDEYITLMTMHSSKGLEFNTVFIIGLEEGIFPSKQSEFDDDLLEEERRLCYVGITRAKKKLYITNTESRMIFGQTNRSNPSRFIAEIPSENIDYLDNTKTGSGHVGIKTGYQNARVKHTGSILSIGKQKQNKQQKQNHVVGDVIKHKIFGQGIIKECLPMGNDVLLTINFDNNTVKKIMANFANLEKV
ncbi:MAG: ATP-dependent helicase [Oscillospiraceae bacterium]